MNDAAEALHSLTRGHGGGDTVEAKVRKGAFIGFPRWTIADRGPVDALLNPCRCLSGGKCNCCRPRAQDPPSGTSTPSDVAAPSQTSTDKLADMFSTVSTTSSETSRVPPPSAHVNRFPLHDSSIRISDTHHPAHTSPYVHKAKLYSPYSPNTRHSSTDPSGTSQKHHRPAARAHASSSSSNPHDSSNTLPSIRSLPTDAAARNNQLKDLVLPSLISFPTAMEITLDGCTCGENCACPGCAVHPQMGAQVDNIEAGKAAHAREGGTCPTSCTSYVRDHVRWTPLTPVQMLRLPRSCLCPRWYPYNRPTDHRRVIRHPASFKPRSAIVCKQRQGERIRAGRVPYVCLADGCTAE